MHLTSTAEVFQKSTSNGKLSGNTSNRKLKYLVKLLLIMNFEIVMTVLRFYTSIKYSRFSILVAILIPFSMVYLISRCAESIIRSKPNMSY